MPSRTSGLMRRAVASLSLFAFMFQPTTAVAATYYFSTSGNDANTGEAPSVPKQSLEAASALALAGNTLLFKRDDKWYSHTSSFDLQGKAGTAEAPILVDAYGDGEKPVVASLQLLSDDGWMNVPGTTTWSQEVSGFSDAWRLYVDGRSKYMVNKTKPAADETAVDQPHEWYIKPAVAGQSGTVFVSTGSATIGPRNVEVHPVGSASTMLMKNTHHLSVRNIDFRGGSQYHVIHVEAPSSHLVFDHNIIRQANGSGLLVGNTASSVSEYVSHVTITNNLVDKVWTVPENDPAGRALSGDGIFIIHAVDTGLIKGNVVRNWGHVGITLSSFRFGFHGVHNFIMEENKVTSGASGYMHAIDVSGFENHTTNNIIRRNVFHDYNATIHAQGNSNKFYSNIFVGVTLTTQPRQSQQPWGIDLIPWRYTDGNWMAAHDNYIVNNTFVDVRGYPIVIGENAATTSAVGNNVVANNIIYSYGLSFTGEVGLNVWPEVRGEIPVRNNNFWDFSPTAPVVRYRNLDTAQNYTAAQLNEAFPQWCGNNTQLDPKFADVPNRDFRLTPASPEAVRSGGLDLSTVMGEGFTDFAGNPWHPATPSMGAFQFGADHQDRSPEKMEMPLAGHSAESRE